MRRNDYSQTSGPAPEAADDAELKALLATLAHQISDAEELHAETVQNIQTRVASLQDRAAEAKPTLPENSVETFERVQGAIVALADRLKETSRRPTPAFDHWDPDPDQSALPHEVRDDVRRAIADVYRNTAPMPHLPNAASSAADTARRPPAEAPHPEPLSYERPVAAATVTPAPLPSATIDPKWLDERFADIAGRIEQSLASINPHNAFLAVGARIDQLEQRFDSAIGALKSSNGSENEALRSVEKQIGDLVAQLDRTEAQLGRLDQIERRISELSSNVSEDRMTQLIGSMAPSDQALSAVAMAASERVAEQIREDLARRVDAPQSDPRLGELTTLMQEFVREQRQGDAQTAEALDTMQLAMQHLIDRVEAIETAQLEARDAAVRAASPPPEPRDVAREPAARTAQPMAVDLPEVPSAVAELAKSPASVMVDGVRIVLPPDAKPHDARSFVTRARAVDDDAPDMSGLLLPEAHAEAYEPEIVPAPKLGKTIRPGDIDRTALIAMARQAAHKASTAPAQPVRTAKPEDAATTRGPFGAFAAAFETLRRPGILVIASFAVFLLAGVWMVAGSGLRGLLPGANGPAKTTSESTPDTSRASEQQDATPGQKQSSLPAGTRAAPHSTPRERTFPGMGRVVEGGVGIMVEEPRTPANPDTVAQVREQIHMANLSARVGQGHAAQQQQDAPIPTTLAAPDQSEDRTPPVRLPEGMARSVEMPPAMIGPLSLRHAAAKGDAAAQFEVASRFAEGKGIPQDFAQAATWYQRAATQGYANAQFRLGALYERGLGVSADLARARVWYTRAAEQGNVRAMHNLAVLSAGRPSVNPDYPAAVRWFSEAANRGLADSQYNLGILYESGLGVPSSSVEAYKWYALAARTGDSEAGKRRDAVRSKLDRSSLHAADALVIQWRAKPAEPITR